MLSSLAGVSLFSGPFMEMTQRCRVDQAMQYERQLVSFAAGRSCYQCHRLY